MYAGLCRWCALIGALIGRLRRFAWGIVLGEEARQHVGDERGGEGGVDDTGERGGQRAHHATSEPLAAA